VTAPVSVLVTARDEDEQIPGALASVAGWVAEIVVVVDPRTGDRTREVAREAGATVLEHPFSSSADQCNWGIERCRNDWVLVLDADERVTPALREAVGRTIAAPAHPAYAIKRTNLAFGRPVRFGDWGADRVVRLFDRRHARFAERAVHGAVTAASVGRLAGTLEHNTLRSLAQYLPKLHDYALLGAGELVAGGRRATVLGAAARAEWRFVRSFVLRLGFLDGGAGFVVAALMAYGTLLKWTAVWETTTSRRVLS
jgi:glycosyltransferase involved in cell wall biosynthesis